jgi:hypothetical protein
MSYDCRIFWFSAMRDLCRKRTPHQTDFALLAHSHASAKVHEGLGPVQVATLATHSNLNSHRSFALQHSCLSESNNACSAKASSLDHYREQVQ